LSVLVVDNEAIFRAGLTAVLESSGIEVSGGCARRHAVELSGQLGVKIALLALRVDDADGLDLVSRFIGLPASPAVVVVMTRADAADALAALRAGASGLVLSDCEPHQLSDAVLAAVKGETRVSPRLAELVVAGWTDAQDAAAERRLVTTRPGSTTAALAERLSPRECQVLALLAVGLSNAAIAGRLTVSTDTVKGHISSIYTKIGTGNRVTAGVLAWQWGLVECPLHGARPSHGWEGQCMCSTSVSTLSA